MKTLILSSVMAFSFSASAQNAVRTIQITAKASGAAVFSCNKICSKAESRAADKASENCEEKGLKVNLISVSGCETVTDSMAHCISSATATFTCEETN